MSSSRSLPATPPPLNRRQISEVLGAMLSPDPTDIEWTAFSVTVSSFYGWCRPDDIDAALWIVHQTRITVERQARVVN